MRLEYAVSGPQGQLGFLLVLPGAEEVHAEIVIEIPGQARQWLEERQGWWIALPFLGALARILDRHGLTGQLLFSEVQPPHS